MTELELVNSDILENNITVEGEYVSESTMESWGWTKFFGVNIVLSLFRTLLLSFGPLGCRRLYLALMSRLVWYSPSTAKDSS